LIYHPKFPLPRNDQCIAAVLVERQNAVNRLTPAGVAVWSCIFFVVPIKVAIKGGGGIWM